MGKIKESQKKRIKIHAFTVNDLRRLTFENSCLRTVCIDVVFSRGSSSGNSKNQNESDFTQFRILPTRY